jgi:hypothetical protein
MDTTFTPAQEQVLALISAGSTISDAAQSAGLHRNTVHNWIRGASLFRSALAEAREAKANYWREQAEQLAPAALDTIRAVMADPNLPASVRLKAALSILALATNPPAAPSETVHNCAQSLPLAPPARQPNATDSVGTTVGTIRRSTPRTGRNEFCPCGSGLKFKRCCASRPLRLQSPAATSIPGGHQPSAFSVQSSGQVG